MEAKVDKFSVNGMKQNGMVPKMVVSQNDESEKAYALVDVNLETNPLDRSCDTRVRLNTRSLQIIYDAVCMSFVIPF